MQSNRYTLTVLKTSSVSEDAEAREIKSDMKIQSIILVVATVIAVASAARVETRGLRTRGDEVEKRGLRTRDDENTANEKRDLIE